jgi:hypothetical protein
MCTLSGVLAILHLGYLLVKSSNTMLRGLGCVYRLLTSYSLLCTALCTTQIRIFSHIGEQSASQVFMHTIVLNIGLIQGTTAQPQHAEQIGRQC